MPYLATHRCPVDSILISFPMPANKVCRGNYVVVEKKAYFRSCRSQSIVSRTAKARRFSVDPEKVHIGALIRFQYVLVGIFDARRLIDDDHFPGQGILVKQHSEDVVDSHWTAIGRNDHIDINHADHPFSSLQQNLSRLRATLCRRPGRAQGNCLLPTRSTTL